MLILLISFPAADSGFGTGKSAIAARELPALSVSVNRAGETPTSPVSARRRNLSGSPVSDRSPPVSTAFPRVSLAPRLESDDIATARGTASSAPGSLIPGSTKLPSNSDTAATRLDEPALPDGYDDALRGYRVALARSAKRFRQYPPVARELRIGGRAEVELVLPLAGGPKLRIKQSSGHVELDQAALEMLQRSVESVDLPIPLRERQIFLSLPVEFVPPP